VQTLAEALAIAVLLSATDTPRTQGRTASDEATHGSSSGSFQVNHSRRRRRRQRRVTRREMVGTERCCNRQLLQQGECDEKKSDNARFDLHDSAGDK